MILLDTMLLVYFIPYLYLFVCYLILSLGTESIGRRPWHERKPAALVTGVAGLLLTLGAMLVAGIADSPLLHALGFIAVVFGAANVFGGFVVTDRMLEMFRKKKVKSKK